MICLNKRIIGIILAAAFISLTVIFGCKKDDNQSNSTSLSVRKNVKELLSFPDDDDDVNGIERIPSQSRAAFLSVGSTNFPPARTSQFVSLLYSSHFFLLLPTGRVE